MIYAREKWNFESLGQKKCADGTTDEVNGIRCRVNGRKEHPLKDKKRKPHRR